MWTSPVDKHCFISSYQMKHMSTYDLHNKFLCVQHVTETVCSTTRIYLIYQFGTDSCSVTDLFQNVALQMDNSSQYHRQLSIRPMSLPPVRLNVSKLPHRQHSLVLILAWRRSIQRHPVICYDIISNILIQTYNSESTAVVYIVFTLMAVCWKSVMTLKSIC